MAIVKLDPFRDMVSLRDRMDRLFEDSLDRFKGNDEESISHATWSPPVDIYETADNLMLKVEAPGVEKEDISVEVNDNELCLKGERKFEKEVKQENFHRIERSYGAFHRVFSLPTSVDKDQVKAVFKNGVLEITLPKMDTAKPRQINVDVE